MAMSQPRPSHRIWLNTPQAFDYEIQGDPGSAKELVLLLHGYNMNGAQMISKLGAILPPDSVVLAPNGPFPMPYKKDGSYRLGYSWYFYDPSTDDYFIDMRVALSAVEQGIHALGLSHLPKRLIGFSQGGYLAPFLTERTTSIQQIIAIGCEYLVKEWPETVRCSIDAIHGEEDEVNSLESARKSYSEMKVRGISGGFYALPGVKHQIDEKVRDQVAELIQKRIE